MRAAIITPPSLGDGFLMLVAAYNLYADGYEVTFFNGSSSFLSLKPLLPPYHFQKSLTDLSSFDLTILENYDSKEARSIIEKRKNLAVFYPTYKPLKHAPLGPQDIVFDPSLPFVKNILVAMEKILLKPPLKEIGLSLPLATHFRRFEKRIVIHPTSGSPSKTWPKKKFLHLGEELKKGGFDPLFVVGPGEIFPGAKAHSLSQLIELLFESGGFIGNDSSIGHIASYLNIPLVTIAPNYRNIALWQPCFNKPSLVLPSRLVPNVKGMRLREKLWHHFISPKRVLEAFIDTYANI